MWKDKGKEEVKKLLLIKIEFIHHHGLADNFGIKTSEASSSILDSLIQESTTMVPLFETHEN